MQQQVLGSKNQNFSKTNHVWRPTQKQFINKFGRDVNKQQIIQKNSQRSKNSPLKIYSQQLNGDQDVNRLKSKDNFKVNSALVQDNVEIKSEDLNKIPIDPHPDLRSGRLRNGMQYHIMENHNPPGRFEVQMEVHAGSINETEEEQGIAHLAEHVTYLGSDKRESLQYNGVKSNAFTDFHHTVFHFNSPVNGRSNKGKMLKAVFDTLVEIVFKPALDVSRIDKEKKAVQAEYRMMNTMEYRQDVEVIKNLHMENMISRRFPIGKMENVQKFNQEMLMNYWKKWYQADNVSLFIVGETGHSFEEIVKEIDSYFGGFKPTRQPLDEQQNANLIAVQQQYREFQALLEKGEEFQGAPLAYQSINSLNGRSNQSIMEIAKIDNYLSYQHGISDRMRILHNWGLGPISISKQIQQTLDKQYLEAQYQSTAQNYECPVDIFQHPLVPQFNLYLQSKTPIIRSQNLEQIKWVIMQRLITTAFQARVSGVLTQYPNCCVQIMSQDSSREDCTITNLIIMCAPDDWKDIVRQIVKEGQRLQKHGLTKSEFEKYSEVTLSSAFIESQQENTYDNNRKIEFMMDVISSGHVYLKDEKLYEYTKMVLQSLTIEETKYHCQQYLAFISHFGREQEYLETFQRDPTQWNYGWPLRSTGVLACVPLYKDVKLEQIQNRPQKSGSLSMSQHIDPAELEKMSEQTDVEAETNEQIDMQEDPSQKFHIAKEEVIEILKEDYGDLEQSEELDTVDYLISPEEIQDKMNENKPHFVAPLAHTDEIRPYDEQSGIGFRKLSNGVRVVLKQTNYEPELISLRLAVLGGFMHDKDARGPYGVGNVRIGQSSLPARQRIGKLTTSQTDNFLLLNNVIMGQNVFEEMTLTDFKAPKDENYLRKAFEVLHSLSTTFIWNEKAFQKAKDSIKESQQACKKVLEEYTTYQILAQMYGTINRLNLPDDEQLDNITIDSVQQVHKQMYVPDNIELIISGDYNIDVLEKYLLEYVGTIGKQEHYKELEDNSLVPIAETPPPEEAKIDFRNIKPLLMRKGGDHKKHVLLHLEDSDERALAVMQARAPSRYGYPDSPNPLPTQPFDKKELKNMYDSLKDMQESKTSYQQLLNATDMKSKHPLYALANQVMIQDIMTSRLFNTVRDMYGLTYDVQFQMSNFEITKGGLWQVRVMAEPNKILMAAEASMEALQSINRKNQLVTPSEVSRAQLNIRTRIEQESQTNEYWIEQMMLLESPINRYKTLETINHVFTYLHALTSKDVNKYIQEFDFDLNNIYTLIGVAGQNPLDFQKSYKKIIMERVKQQDEKDQREDFAKYFVQDEDWFKQQVDIRTKFNFWKKVSKVVRDAQNQAHLII